MLRLGGAAVAGKDLLLRARQSTGGDSLGAKPGSPLDAIAIRRQSTIRARTFLTASSLDKYRREHQPNHRTGASLSSNLRNLAITGAKPTRWHAFFDLPPSLTPGVYPVIAWALIDCWPGLSRVAAAKVAHLNRRRPARSAMGWKRCGQRTAHAGPSLGPAQVAISNGGQTGVFTKVCTFVDPATPCLATVNVTRPVTVTPPSLSRLGPNLPTLDRSVAPVWSAYTQLAFASVCAHYIDRIVSLHSCRRPRAWKSQVFTVKATQPGAGRDASAAVAAAIKACSENGGAPCQCA